MSPFGKHKLGLQHVPGSPKQICVLETQTLPFEDQFFSLITCFDVLEHLDEQDIDTTISEILRVLRPGGRLLWFRFLSEIGGR